MNFTTFLVTIYFETFFVLIIRYLPLLPLLIAGIKWEKVFRYFTTYLHDNQWLNHIYRWFGFMDHFLWTGQLEAGTGGYWQAIESWKTV